MTIRVVLADDQESVRRNLRLILEFESDISVVGEAADGAAAITTARELRPDVVLVDIRMPGLDGLEVTRQLAGAGVADPLRVVVVTTFDLDEYVYAALRHGACGFLLKRAGPAQLVQGVRAAVAGDTLISPSVTVRMLRAIASRSGPPADNPLTPRETEIARHVAQGLTNAEIGAALYVTAGTVKTHVAHIQRKLGARNRVAIAAWAFEYRL
jgi:DNA-binding NarL/FixJ family response regulator